MTYDTTNPLFQAMQRHMPREDGEPVVDPGAFLRSMGLGTSNPTPSGAIDGRDALREYSDITATMSDVDKAARSMNSEVGLRTAELARAWQALEQLGQGGDAVRMVVDKTNERLRSTGHHGAPVESAHPLPSMASIVAGLPASLRAALGR